MTKTNLELPDLPSELIESAMGDLERVENDARYVIDMTKWHEPNQRTGLCSVCLAGAVMSRKFGPNSEVLMFGLDGETFDNSTLAKLLALDYFRNGSVAAGLVTMGFEDNVSQARRKVTPYETNPVYFREDMRDLVKYLRNHGL